jgi:hypothetical protein
MDIRRRLHASLPKESLSAALRLFFSRAVKYVACMALSPNQCRMTVPVHKGNVRERYLGCVRGQQLSTRSRRSIGSQASDRLSGELTGRVRSF